MVLTQYLSFLLFVSILGPYKVLDIFLKGLVVGIGLLHILPIFDSFFLNLFNFLMQMNERFQFLDLSDLVPYILGLLLFFLIVLLLISLAHYFRT